MQDRIHLEILPQPDDTTCGPTCLHAVYRYYDEDVSLEAVIGETGRLDEGGTLAVLLGTHALDKGYRATIYTYNLSVFDPTWFGSAPTDLVEKLRAQAEAKDSTKLRLATQAYVDFLAKGGNIRMVDLTAELLLGYLRRGVPLLTGLSATYLYQCARESGEDNRPDDVGGEAAGHFVVLCGYDEGHRKALVADPYLPHPFGVDHYYEVDLDRLVCAILLGVLTYDANLLMIQQNQPEAGS